MTPNDRADRALGGIGPLAGRQCFQVGILVENLETALRSYTSLWGIAPWRLWTSNRRVVPSLEYRGRAGTFSMRIALSATEPQLELIEPLEGPSLYHEWTDHGRYGLHHLAVRVPALLPACGELEDTGFEVLQRGRGYGIGGDGGFTYFDMRAELGLYLELIEAPRQRLEPEASYPAIR
jgi:methylmalonyl-CoA/ethylmalonyl-CoA epimerase